MKVGGAENTEVIDKHNNTFFACLKFDYFKEANRNLHFFSAVRKSMARGCGDLIR